MIEPYAELTELHRKTEYINAKEGRNEEGKLKEDEADVQELYAIYLTRFLRDRQGRNRAGLKNEYEKYDEQ